MKVTHHNLRIEVELSEVESYALGAIDVLRRRYGQKVHFLTEDKTRFPKIIELSREVDDLTVFEPGAWPGRHFQNVARVVDQNGDLYVVTPGTGRPLRSNVREISKEIEKAAARRLLAAGGDA